MGRVTPINCCLCGRAHVREESPLVWGWQWCSAASSWVCARCVHHPDGGQENTLTFKALAQCAEEIAN